MVKDSRKALRIDSFKPVNLPEQIEVELDPSGKPQAVRLPNRQAVTAIDDCWRLDDEWWRNEPLSRLYWAVRLTSGNQLVVYQDLVNGDWYRQSY